MKKDKICIFKNQGFTLIELLVVIAIIGLLSTMATISLNGARIKARDARRLADVRQLSMAVELSAANSATSDYSEVLSACSDAGTKTTDCGIILNLNFANVVDPVGQGGADACADDNSAGCDYSIGNSDVTNTEYAICFYLEEDAGSIGAGINHVEQGGSMAAGCP
ncbi:MAG: type II secretion system protein [Patescibacteria group bacterium]|jgi:prepilin-type N-terminal cleavage/methylation domain-containing protein